VGDKLLIELTQGEDFAGAIFWSSQYNVPFPITDPVLMDVKDSNGQIAFRFTDTNDITTDPHIEIAGTTGYFQLTCPASYSRLVVPGTYEFDLWATVADAATPFDSPGQLKPVIDGWLQVNPRTSRVEDILAATESLPAG
jgi:hypothetical protein